MYICYPFQLHSLRFSSKAHGLYGPLVDSSLPLIVPLSHFHRFSAPTFTHPEEMKAMQKFDKDNPPILVCKADGNPKPTVLWYKENERITNKSGEISANRFTLRVKSSNAKDKIKYRCLVSNKYGNISYEFVIDVPGNYICI